VSSAVNARSATASVDLSLVGSWSVLADVSFHAAAVVARTAGVTSVVASDRLATVIARSGVERHWLATASDPIESASAPWRTAAVEMSRATACLLAVSAAARGAVARFNADSERPVADGLSAFGVSERGVLASAIKVVHMALRREHPASCAPLPIACLPFPPRSRSCTPRRRAHRARPCPVPMALAPLAIVISTQTFWRSLETSRASRHPSSATTLRIFGGPLPWR
jgi:hypothetical protein